MQQDLLDYFIHLGQQAPSADNSQPWRFHWDGNALTLSFDHQRGKDTLFGPEGHGTLLCMGAVMENWRQACQAAGLKYSWENDERPGHYGKLIIIGGTTDTKPPTEHPALLRHTNRGAFRDDPIPGDIANALISLQEGSAGIRLFNERDSIRRIADLVNLASQMRFQNQAVHEWLGRSLRFSDDEISRGDGLDIDTLALPPGGKALLSLIKDWKRMEFLNHFGAYRLLARIESQNIVRAPAIVAVTGGEGRDSVLAAGRVMERAWILLNSHGVAVHPYYVVSDQLLRCETHELQKHLEAQGCILSTRVAELFGSETRVHMLLRVGIPKTKAKKSLRLSMAQPIKNTQAP